MDEEASRAEITGTTAQVDRDGKFQIPGMAPGKYRLFAIQGFDEAPWGSPELAAELTAKSVVVELKDAEVRRIEPPLISADEWTAALRKLGM